MTTLPDICITPTRTALGAWSAASYEPPAFQSREAGLMLVLHHQRNRHLKQQMPPGMG